ncbi:MAG: exopolysaccharide Pel transporter PelG [Hyphomicrobiaceae bacterium]
MAGIGFRLRALSEQDTLTSVVAAVGHAAVIAAGPWLFTIVTLAAITLSLDRVVELGTLAAFRIVIIYAFASSLVVTAPITIVATRLVADALWLKNPQAVRPLLFAAFAAALCATALASAFLIAFFRPPAAIAVTLAAGSMIVGLIWVVISFCGAVRDYRGVTYSFFFGLLVSTLSGMAAGIAGYGAAGIAAGFLLGLLVTFLGLTSRVLATFPQPLTDPMAGLRQLVYGTAGYWRLALGALAGTAGVWIDKWIFWSSAAGERLAVGLWHAPLYDSAMFIASLGIIPALSAFVVKLETDFFERYQRYYATISSHGTYGQIEEARRTLHGFTLDNLTLITVWQIGICAVLALTAPLLIEALGLQFRQVAILRYGALGAVFQFVFIACSAMLLFFDRRRLYMWMQVLFLALMAGLTLLSLRLGEDYYGTGYFLACLVAGFAVYRLADTTFDNLNYLTFIGNNPSIEPAAAHRRRTFWAILTRRSAT